MKITTSRFGDLEINADIIFNFVEPILGYEHLSKFVLVDNVAESPFKWLQAVDDGNIAFPVTVPGYFGLDYQFVIPDGEAKKLNLTGTNDLLSLNIVCIPQGKPEEASINLLGPIIINLNNRKAMQLVLINDNLSVRHKLFQDKSEKQESEKALTNS
ncbi:MAG: flagellar assembly protein FliW [Candidatus Gastranaerophilales bacterium]|nr:flagellar assembly protein FliW [Candidatus Gastranaerophilales bacterium]